MGVHGLWRLIEPSGKPVPLETLENKVLAVDISIWLHQAVKGFQDARGAPLPNAHLLGIYHRVCKLLYFRIKPVFVFDGGVPILKKQTIAKRSQQSTKIRNDATSLHEKIFRSLLKHSAIQTVLQENGEEADQTTVGKNILFRNKEKDDMFKLPDKPISDLDSTLETDSSEFTDETSDSSPTKQWDLHTIDEKSKHFLSLPAEVRHDILTELKDQRKQSSWGRLHELPKQSGDFSQFQMKRLLKRYSVQVSLEEATKEMGGHVLSLNELEALLKEEGIVTASNKSNKRIASDENKSYLLIKDVKKAMEKARIDEENKKIIEEKSETVPSITIDNESSTKDPDYERDLQEAIKLSLMETPSTSKEINDSDYLLGFNDGDFDSSSDSEEEFVTVAKKARTPAETYMLEYADLTPFEVENLFKKDNRPEKNKSKKGKVLNIDYKENKAIINNLDKENGSTDAKLNDQHSCIDKNILENTNEKFVDKHFFDNVIKQNVDTKIEKTESNVIKEDHKLDSNSEIIGTDSKLNGLISESDEKLKIKLPAHADDQHTTLKVTSDESDIRLSLPDEQLEIKSDSDESDNHQVIPKTKSDALEISKITDVSSDVKNDRVEIMSDSDESDNHQVTPEVKTDALEISKIKDVSSDVKNDQVEIMSDSDESDNHQVIPDTKSDELEISKIKDVSSDIKNDRVEIMSDSDESDNHQVTLETNSDALEISKIKDVSSDVKNDRVEIMSDSDESDNHQVTLETKSDALEISKDVKNDQVEIMSDSDESDFVEVKKPSGINTDQVEIMSNSDDSDFIEVKSDNLTELKNNDTIEIMSDSDDSDLVEVKVNLPEKVSFEVVIDPTNKIEDDIFKDIFEEPQKNIEIVKNIPEITPINVMPIKNVPETSQVEENTVQIIENTTTLVTIDKKTEKRVTFDKDIIEKDKASPKKDVIVPKKPKMTVEQLNKLQEDIRKEQQELTNERNSKDRMGANITNQMYQEAQELLELFGVPYIIAPQEAEAQCAFLNSINLTDGTITDDSDIWLFGGHTVYKNFFNQKKHVLEYQDKRIQQHFKLTREQMILLALLVGSDYTIGIQGIGPVTALEILAAFPPSKNIQSYINVSELLSGLSEFKHWLSDGGKLGLGRTTLRSKLQNIQISEGFPSIPVVQAYLKPEVETNEDKFSWGKPDVVGLVDYAREKFGWTRMKTEEILNPVIKRLEDVNKQKSIRDYFATKHKLNVDLEGKVSKRVKVAIERMGKTKEELRKEEEVKSKRGKKGQKSKEPRKRSIKQKIVSQDEEKLNSIEDTIEIGQNENETDKLVAAKDLETLIIKDKPKQRRTRNYTEVDKPKKPRRSKSDIHIKEVIPQREKDKTNALKSKLKAIEIFRKSKIEGKHEKHVKKVRQPKEDAELSESSESS